MKGFTCILAAFLLYAFIAVSVLSVTKPKADELGQMWNGIAARVEEATK